MPVHGHFLANLAGPLVIVGAGTAFAFIPISIAALAGVASHTQALLHTGHHAPTALTGGFQAASLVLGAIGLIAVPAILALVRHDELSDAVARTTVREPPPALAAVS